MGASPNFFVEVLGTTRSPDAEDLRDLLDTYFSSMSQRHSHGPPLLLHMLLPGVLLSNALTKMAANSSSTGSKSGTNTSGGKQSGPSAEQVVSTFQRMRQEQRSMASKAAELEMEINEHSLVIDTLKDVDPSRKCFRLVGGVLVERTVKEVLPALETNKEQISKIIESLNTQMQSKGRELTEYRERYNIRLVGEGEGDTQGQSAASSRDSEGGGSKTGAGVLVS